MEISDVISKVREELEKVEKDKNDTISNGQRYLLKKYSLAYYDGCRDMLELLKKYLEGTS